MKPLMTCAAARRKLQAFYDGELPHQDHLAVQAHVAWCDRCADALNELRLVGRAVRVAARAHVALSQEEAALLAAAVVSRRKAEDAMSWSAWIGRLFDDWHLIYAGLGAAAATAACLVVILGMLRFAPTEHPDASPFASLAGIMSLLATPVDANAIALDAASHARGTARFQAASENAAEDAVFELATIVTRGERLVNLERLRTGRKATREQARAIDAFLESVARARFDPAQDSAAAGSGMVWLVTRMTVRATKPLDIDLPLPPAKTPPEGSSRSRA